MKIKGITDECFTDYKEPVMYIAFPSCTFKCDIENGCALCQNSALAKEPDIEISKEDLIQRYINNPITKGIVLAGLEPFDSMIDLLPFVDCFRRQYKRNDPIIIYTGYTEDELDQGTYGYNYGKEYNQMLADQWQYLQQYGIIVKFGRFRPNQKVHFDGILGIYLASDNQYAKEFNNAYTY